MGAAQKVHRRRVRLDDGEYTVLSPRPMVTERFATQRGEQAWRIITDAAGAQLLARLCWAMAFQDRPRTLVVIDQSFLAPNPWDTTASRPIVIANGAAGALNADAAAALGALLPLTADSEGTVVLQTRGLHLARADPDAFAAREDQAPWRDRDDTQRHVRAEGGLVVLEAVPAVLRAWGVALAGADPHAGPEYTGEVHVLEVLLAPLAHGDELGLVE
jgi:hypothetical protein